MHFMREGQIEFVDALEWPLAAPLNRASPTQTRNQRRIFDLPARGDSLSVIGPALFVGYDLILEGRGCRHHAKHSVQLVRVIARSALRRLCSSGRREFDRCPLASGAANAVRVYARGCFDRRSADFSRRGALYVASRLGARCSGHGKERDKNQFDHLGSPWLTVSPVNLFRARRANTIR